MIEKVVSGGQTGVDRAALSVAIAMEIEHGGWCPKGRRAEDGKIPSEFDLSETPSRDYSVRTQWNVRDSDGTLVLYDREISGGTKLTCALAQQLDKPLLALDLSGNVGVEQAIQWIEEFQIKILNIAGPRESGAPGISEAATIFLTNLFIEIRSVTP